MKWVDTNDEMPAVGRRVLCAMYAETEHPYWAGGFFDGEYWIIDDVQQLVDKKGYSSGRPSPRYQGGNGNGPKANRLDGVFPLVPCFLGYSAICAAVVKNEDGREKRQWKR